MRTKIQYFSNIQKKYMSFGKLADYVLYHT